MREELQQRVTRDILVASDRASSELDETLCTMKRPLVSFTLLAVLAGTVAITLLRNLGAKADGLQASEELKWYRGNLHTHSHWSDGDDYLEMIAKWYREQGYQFLVFTDHNVLANTERWIDIEKSAGGPEAFKKLKATFPQFVQERTSETGELEVRLRTFQEVDDQMKEPGEFLLIQGEEISDSFEKLPIHLNASNVAEVIPPMMGSSVLDTIQNNVRAVLAQRKRTGQPMIVHLNHPNFEFAIPAEDLMRVRGERFFEVYNGHPRVFNSGDETHAGTERIWDIVLTRRLTELDLPIMYGLAVDDGHNYHDISSHKSNPGRGWVMVLANELSAKSLIDAMEAGRFYASSGVKLHSVETSVEGLSIQVVPVEGETSMIEFIGTRKGYDADSYPVRDREGREIRATHRYSNDIGEILKTVRGDRGTYQFTGDEIYVRARITSSGAHPNPSESGDQKRAWCQPVVGPGADARE